MIKHYLKNNNGMTLIECVIAMMIATIIMMAGVVTFLNFYENYYDTQEKNLQATVMDGVTDLLSEELRYATSVRIQDDENDAEPSYTDLEKIVSSETGVVFYSGTNLADTTSLAGIASEQMVSLTFRYYTDEVSEAEAATSTSVSYVIYVDILVESTTSDNYLQEQIAIKLLNMELIEKSINTSNTPSTGNILYYSKSVE